jgi:hypothetical protein
MGFTYQRCAVLGKPGAETAGWMRARVVTTLWVNGRTS